ncbi:MAG: DUF423 domain-containing protein [Cellvibrionaceae bacterium]
MSANIIIFLASLNGFLAVGIGAFGAHALKAKLPEKLLSTYQTGVEYHFYHALALLAVGILMSQPQWQNNSLLSASGISFLVGILFFCGSLYWLALGGPRWLGPITPLGGLLFLSGWLLLAIAAIKN